MGKTWNLKESTAFMTY